MWNLFGLRGVFSANPKSIFRTSPAKPKTEETANPKPEESTKNVASGKDSKSKPNAKTKPAMIQGRKRSLEEFRSVFGHVEGTVMYLDGISFECAAQTFIGALNQKIAKQNDEKEAIEALCKSLTEQIGPRDDEDIKPDDSQKARRNRYAKNLESKIRAAKTQAAMTENSTNE